ncbi:MAG: HipA domain-containing protein [Mariprofundaceae bacterium]|nr:HipA domain-containing protein [Mariprofundaceae bacterium]
MRYILKQFDYELITFELASDVIEGLSAQIVSINETHHPLLPIDLELSEKGLLTWLKRRVIPGNRLFVQNLLAKLGLNVGDTKGIIDVCKGLSVNDCYWIVEQGFEGSFRQFNLYENRISRILSFIAYTGYGETKRHGFISTPELTTGGMLAKCWRREQGTLYLYKAGSTGAANTGNEPYSEFYAAQVAKAMGLNCTPYNLRRWKKQLFSTCPLFTSLELSYVPAGRVVNNGGWRAVMDYYRKLGDDYDQSLVDMLIFDAVICNEDRHFNNFGLLLESGSNRVVAPAPIFDNGFSLFNYAMADDLEDVDAYAQTRLMATSQGFVEFAREIISKEQKNRLHKLVNFRFKRHPKYNLPAKRLEIIEQFIQMRIQQLINL